MLFIEKFENLYDASEYDGIFRALLIEHLGDAIILMVRH